MEYPHDTIVLNLLYPKKFLGIQYIGKRKIGFYFTNLSNYLFAQNNNLKDSDDYKKWVEKNGQNMLVSESLYSSALAYCMNYKKPENFTKDGLFKALSLMTKEDQDKLVKCWKYSETLGATIKKKSQTKAKKNK